MDDERDMGRFLGYTYPLSLKILMLSIIVILFFVVMVCLHMYARWNLLLLRARRRHHFSLSLSSSLNLVINMEREPHSPLSEETRGLDATVLESLPAFVYSSETRPDNLDCAVCLSEFQEGESGRLLPKCNHSFHIDCIDMWFHSHSTCPLCRLLVEPGLAAEPENSDQYIVSVTEEGSSSDMCDTSRQQEEEESVETTSSSGDRRRRKTTELVQGVSIEEMSRNYNEDFEDESTGYDSDSSQSSFRSPLTLTLSFKRILSRERRENSPPSVTAESCSTAVVAAPDMERGHVAAI